MWCGGILGVISVAVCNVIVPRIPACKLTLFTFCGQLFCGIALDILNGRELNEREFHAGLLVSMGDCGKSAFSSMEEAEKNNGTLKLWKHLRSLKAAPATGLVDPQNSFSQS